LVPTRQGRNVPAEAGEAIRHLVTTGRIQLSWLKRAALQRRGCSSRAVVQWGECAGKGSENSNGVDIGPWDDPLAGCFRVVVNRDVRAGYRRDVGR